MLKIGRKISRWCYNLPYKYKIFLSTSIISIIPIIILGSFTFRQSRQLLYTAKNNDINYYFNRASQTLQDEMNRCESIIYGIEYEPQFNDIFHCTEDIAQTKSIVELMQDKLPPYVYNIKKYNPVIRDLTFYTKLDIPLYQSLIRAYDEQLFPKDFELKSNEYNWYYNGSSIVVSHMIFDSNNQQHIGNLSILINPKDFIGNTASPEFFNYSVVLFSPDGKCAYSHLLYKDKKNLLPIDSSVINKNFIKKNGRRYLVKSVSVGTGWTLCAYVDEATVTSGNETIITATLAIALTCLAAVIIFSIMFSFTFTKRITSLSDTMSQVSEGNLELDIHSDYTDEIGVLTNHFGEMTVKINELIQNVYKSQIIQQKAELKALQAQIKPHFLYNTLQAINWNAINHGDTETSQIVVNLSNFYRLILNRGEEDISAEDELMIVKYYVNIEETVHRNFKVYYDIDETIYSYKVIPLILQPIVENAIKHGIETENRKNGEIYITAKRSDGNLLFSVSDNGKGLSEEDRSVLLHRSSHGYGLKNVNDRIRLRFGEQYGISIASPKNPTTFQILLPIITEQNRNEDSETK